MKPIVHRVSKESDPQGWLALRRTGIGGSDVARICGVSPFGGPLTVWLEKRGEVPDRESSEAMELGEWLEEAIAQLFSKRTGYKVKPSNVVLRHQKHQFMLASIDRWVEDDTGATGVLEVKNVGEYMAADWADEQIPDYYMLQVQHYLCVTGLDYAWIAPLLGGNRLRPIRIDRNDALIDELIEIERKFWRMVEDATPPAIDDSPEAERVLRLCYPESDPTKQVTLDDERQDVFKKFIQARAAAALLKTEIQGYKNQLMEFMKDAEAAYIPGQEKPCLTYKGTATHRLDATRLAAEHPEVVAPYYIESSTRRFLVKGEKNED